MSSAKKDLRDQPRPILDTPSPSVKRGKIATARFIAETAHAVAIYQPGEGDVLYITFNSENERAKGLGFSGDRLLRRLGRPAIGMMSTVANWYPKTAMASILAAAQAVIGEGEFSHVICFGHGMGGYGALRFAAELQAEVAIAFSPITTIDPGQTSVPNKFWPRIDPSFRSGMPLEPRHIAQRNYVIYDQHSHHDRWHANRLAAFPAMERVLFPMIGHETLAAFGEEDDVMGVIDALMAGEPKRARRCIRGARNRSASYHERLSEVLAGRGLAEAAAKTALFAAELQPEAHRIRRRMMPLIWISSRMGWWAAAKRRRQSPSWSAGRAKPQLTLGSASDWPARGDRRASGWRRKWRRRRPIASICNGPATFAPS